MSIYPSGHQIIEAHPGRARRRALEEQAASLGGSLWILDCHFEHDGPWAGVRQWFQAMMPSVDRPDLVRRHDYELVHVLPELQRQIEVRNPTLTDSASYEEKTRNYPAERAFRIVHGLIDLLDAWRDERGDDGPWVLACDHFDHISNIGRDFFREALRRRGARWNLTFVLGVDPGRATSAQDLLGLSKVAVDRLDVTPEVPEEMTPDEALRRVTALEEAVGEDRIEIQTHLSELIRLRSLAGDERKHLSWRCLGLEIYNSLGLYEDALVYGDGALEGAERIAPDLPETHWSIFIKLFISLVGVGRVEEALEQAMGMAERSTSLKHQGLLCYLIAMLHGRLLPERDYPLAEDYLARGLQLLQEADMPEHERHFQTVFNRNGLAMVRTFQGRLDDALTLCQDGLAQLERHLEPDAHRLHRSVLYYNMAQVYTYIDAVPEALANFTAAMEMDPHYSEYFNERGNVLLRAGRPEEALEDYLAAVELSPPYFELYSNLGQCYRLLGRFEEAIAAYDRTLDLKPDLPVALLGRAQAYEALGLGQAAHADYDALLGLEPENWQARAARAVLLYERGDHEASRRDLDHAIVGSPEMPDLYQNRAVVLTDLGQIDAAITDLNHYLELAPRAPDRPEVEAQIRALRESSAAVVS